MSSLSVIIITKNEEHNIHDCLASVKWANEIVIVDGGSSDRTVDLARQVTKDVYERPWEGYGAAKNFALSQCSGEWVLWLDADERVTSELKHDIQEVIHSMNSPYTGYSMPRKAFFLGRWIKHCGWYPGLVLRLFKRESGKFTENKVHERLEVQGKLGTLCSDILHYTDPNLFHYFDKFNRYTSLAAEELFEEKRSFSLIELLTSPAWKFFKMYFLQLGFLDGIQGFILCILSSLYVFTKYAKLWEQNHLKLTT